MKALYKRLFYTFGLALCCSLVQAQTLNEAKEMCDNGEYAEALPVFAKLIKRSPGNGSYNHWLGVCYYKTGDWVQAEKYLKAGVKRKVQPSYLYLSELYFNDYRFEESVELLDEYVEMMETRRKDPVEDIDERMSLVKDGLRMMEKVEDIQVIDSVVCDKNQFLSAYTLSEECGTLSTFAEVFEHGSDTLSVYKNQKGDKIYYARKTDEDRMALYTQSLLMDKWGDEKQMPMNTEGQIDDNYPFVLSDGVTVYYSSTGNGTIGGYDLFVTRYNSNSETYLAPEQLGMPFNSPYNDYMIVFDEIKNLGWFVSDRFQPEDKVCVYLFIPNPEHSRVDSEDPEVKRAAASLKSIKATWKEEGGYGDLVALSHQAIPYGKQEVKKDFEFIIGNGTVYYSLDEITNAGARSLYQKVLTARKQIKVLNSKLDKMRAEYAKGTNARKEQLKPQILQAEAQLDQLLDQPAELEKKARNAEIEALRLKR